MCVCVHAHAFTSIFMVYFRIKDMIWYDVSMKTDDDCPQKNAAHATILIHVEISATDWRALASQPNAFY